MTSKTNWQKQDFPIQPTQLYLSGEEFGVNDQSGIHSINVQQNFYLPKAAKAQQSFYKQGAALAEKQLALTDHELKRQVKQAYYQLLYAKQEQKLVAENAALYNSFYRLLPLNWKLVKQEESHNWQLVLV